VNSTVETAPSASPYRLETFGTLVLRETGGRAPTADHGQQRWRLALLAVLAASGAQGVSRDRLLLLFWPDASQERARHSLEQLLYKMRKAMGASVFAGVNPLRLDPGVMTSDVEDFQRSIEGGDLEAAVGHYRGPFLDGFYLSDSPEFEEWTIGERSRLESVYADALERLAVGAEGVAEYGTAVRWHRELCRLDPLSSRNALGLMRALADSGDHASALRHGEQYERLVRQELGTGAGPEIAALVAEIHSRTTAEPFVGRRPPPGDAAIDRPGRIAVPPKAAEAPPPATKPARRQLSRSLLIALVGIGILAVVLYAAGRLRNTPAEVPAPAAGEPSIAVLPLTDLSTDPADAALADGMTQELIAMLGRSPDLRVIASTSAFALEERGMDVRQIADSLRVSHVLEGGVQKVGSRLRMQVRLVDARDGTTRWSETYDREMGDIFAVQEEISFAVARELDVRLTGRGRLGGASRRHTTNLAAYQWYLRGITADPGRASGRLQATEFLSRAIAADSGFAPAYARLSFLHLSSSGITPGDHREWFRRAEEVARRAVALDDSLAEAHAALGWALHANNDYTAAEAELKRAIALDPNVYRGYEGLARIYMMTGRPDEQLAVAWLGMEIDPFSTQAIRELALALNTNDRCDETLELLRPMKSLSPRVGVTGIIMGLCYAKKEMWPEAVGEFRWATEETDAKAALAFLGYSLARAGQREEAMRILSDLLAGRQYSHGAFGIAVVYTGLRDYDQAFVWLDKAVEEGSDRVYIMDPVFEDLHRDPRFERLRARMGLQNR
jgi:TolB-like protein/DNA-binding SARP family transcriptional activator